jgi:hypothetical protein
VGSDEVQTGIRAPIPIGHRHHRPVHIDIVCQAAGLTTAEYSLGYVASWSGGNLKAVTATAERVTDCARTILDRSGFLGSSDEREAA